MGAAPGPSPSTVATQFARVYYRVAAKLPARLSEFYGDASELDHGPSFRASGRDAITRLAEKLPLATARTDITAVVGQPSTAGNVLVIVSGTCGSPPLPFSQTFLLAKQTDSHDEHFFCRNDVFVRFGAPASSAEANTASAGGIDARLDDGVIKAGAEDSGATTITDTNTTTSSTSVAKDPPAEPVTPPKHRASPPLVQKEVQSPVGRDPVAVTSTDMGVNGLPDDVKNADTDLAADGMSGMPAAKPPTSVTAAAAGVAASPPQMVSTSAAAALQRSSPSPPPSNLDIRDPPSDASPVGSVSSTTAAPASVANPSADNTVPGVGNPQAQAVARGAQLGGDDSGAAKRAVRPASVKKTWASIVLSIDDAHATSSTGGSSAVSSSTSSVPQANVAAPVPAGPVVVQAEPPHAGNTRVPAASIADARGPPPADLEGMSKEGRVAGNGLAGNNANYVDKGGMHNTGTMNRGGAMNGGRGMHHHHMGRSGPRVFGPSAVVTLASTGMSMADPRAVTNSLREEFSRYGHKLRGVEVKAGKGIAFIEYESADGVRAAVDAWAHGARSDGVFAGIALHVTEKRVTNMGRRPGAMRGMGRGGPRGGARRARPPSGAMG